MEDLVDRGLVPSYRHFQHDHPQTATSPARRSYCARANEMELHPHFQQPELFDYVLAQGIQQLGLPHRLATPARRDRTPDDSVDIEDPVMVAIARDNGVHPAVNA